MTWPVFAQRNVPGLPPVPWAGEQLGSCRGVTIGSDGCYDTAMAQVATRFEAVTSPTAINQVQTARGLYVNGCLVVDSNLSKLFPAIQYVETRNWSAAADLAWIGAMAENEEIIIGLDNLNRGTTSRHFARVWGYDPRTGILMIDDPWWGRTLNFASIYGDPRKNVMKGVKFRRPGWVPPEKRSAPAPLAPLPTYTEWIAANVHRPDLQQNGRPDPVWASALMGEYRKEVHR